MEEYKTDIEEEEERERGQEIWSWGAGTEGQLGTGRLEDEHTPQLLHSLSSIHPISSLSCGGAHVIALTPDGRVLTWGRGSSGQLGHGEMVNSLQPKLVKAVEGLVISHVSAGWNHSGFVSDPLGNQVYGFGSGKRGQLGVSNEKVKSTNLPQITLGLTDVKIICINANGDHSAALSNDGRLYTWGRGFCSATDLYIPHCYPSDLSFDEVALGWNHALVQTSEHKVFMLGGYHHGVLGDPQKTALMKHISEESKEGMMQRIPKLDEAVLHIASGAEHSALVTGDGSVMTWGWGEHGQLGLGDTVDQTDPQVVNLGHNLAEGHAISRVCCGSGFTFVLRTYDAHSQSR